MNLEEVLSHLAVKDFHLHMSKCQFTVSKLTFHDHIISNEGIELDPKNVQPIHDAPAPKTVLEVKGWLGMVGHYSNFFPDLATITKPLRRLQINEEPFNWNAECQTAFDADDRKWAQSAHLLHEL